MKISEIDVGETIWISNDIALMATTFFKCQWGEQTVATDRVLIWQNLLY